MDYFAGVFDAEGSLSLSKNGAFPISIEMSNEEIPKLFKNEFGGSIYTRQRTNRKRTWIWKINSKRKEAYHFLECMHPLCLIKEIQIHLLMTYLEMNKSEAKENRNDLIQDIREEKQPVPFEKFIYWEGSTEPCEAFFKWFAGFIDGDGNFVCNQYTDKRNNKKYFGHQISFSTIHGCPLATIDTFWKGTIVRCHRNKNTLYKWSPLRENERVICESILPFLKVKKKQCELFLEFIDCQNDSRKLEIIESIKHLNSL